MKKVFLSIAAIAVISVRWVPHWRQWDFCDSGLGFHAVRPAAHLAKPAATAVSTKPLIRPAMSITRNAFSVWIVCPFTKTTNAVCR